MHERKKHNTPFCRQKSRFHVDDLSNWPNMRPILTGQIQTARGAFESRTFVSKFKQRNSGVPTAWSKKTPRPGSSLLDLFLRIYRTDCLVWRCQFHFGKNDKWHEWLSSRTAKEIPLLSAFHFHRLWVLELKRGNLEGFNESPRHSLRIEFINIHNNWAKCFYKPWVWLTKNVTTINQMSCRMHASGKN